MQLRNSVRSIVTSSLCVIFALGFVSTLQAQDKKADPTGTWTWMRQGRGGGGEVKMTLKLKTEGDKLTGKLTSPGRQGGDPVEVEIKDGKIKGDEVSFSVTREVNGNTFTSKYNGKVTGDTIKGKTEFERNGETQSRDWEAKRDTAKK
jgi:hypothetical protein